MPPLDPTAGTPDRPLIPTLRRFLPYLWPAGRPDLKARVVGEDGLRRLDDVARILPPVRVLLLAGVLLLGVVLWGVWLVVRTSTDLAAAAETVPVGFLEWLRPGGRMFIVRGVAPAMEAVLVRMEGDAVNGTRTESLFETDLAYLQGAAPTPRFQF